MRKPACIHLKNIACEQGARRVRSAIGLQVFRPHQHTVIDGSAGRSHELEALHIHFIHALPTATAMLRLAPALAAAGQCVNAAGALPLYVRDKVALTTEERALVREQKAQAALAAEPASDRQPDLMKRHFP